MSFSSPLYTGAAAKSYSLAITFCTCYDIWCSCCLHRKNYNKYGYQIENICHCYNEANVPRHDTYIHLHVKFEVPTTNGVVVININRNKYGSFHRIGHSHRMSAKLLHQTWIHRCAKYEDTRLFGIVANERNEQKQIWLTILEYSSQ